MPHIFETVTGTDGALSFQFNGQFALKNYNVEIVNGNRLKVVSTENEMFSLLEAEVTEIEINGQIYSDASAAQLALQTLVYTDSRPVVLTEEMYLKLASAVQASDRGQILPNTPMPSGGWLIGWYTAGVSSAAPGTNYPNQNDLKADEDYTTKFYFNGTAWVAQKDKKVKSNADGVVTSGNTDAVSGETVYNTLNPKPILIYTNKLLNSRVANTIVDNTTYDIYLLAVEAADVVKVKNYYGNAGGLEYGFIGFSLDGKTLDSWLFLSSEAPVYAEHTVTAPNKGFLLINYRKGTSNVLTASFATLKETLYKSQLVTDKGVNNENLPVASSLVYGINQDLKSLNIKSEIIASNATHTSVLAASFRYLSYSNRLFSSKLIKNITVRITTAGTFSVLRTKGRLTSGFAILEKKTFTVVVGANVLDVGMLLNKDEDLNFIDVGDTAVIGYITGGANPLVGSFIAYSTTSSVWNTYQNNLNIKVEAVYFPIDKLLKGKTMSILGDSVSTYAGFIPVGNNNFYPRPEAPEINDMSLTYWGKLITNDEMGLNINNSSSGSQVVSTSGALSFYNRVTNLGNPDYIFLFGGTNDWLNNVSLGSGDFSLPIDITTFTGSYRYVVEYILNNHPSSRLIVLIPMQRRTAADTFPSLNTAGVAIQAFIKRVIEICDYYGIDYIRTDLVYTNFNWEIYSGDGTHPNIKGMKTIYSKIKNRLLEYEL